MEPIESLVNRRALVIKASKIKLTHSALQHILTQLGLSEEELDLLDRWFEGRVAISD